MLPIWGIVDGTCACGDESCTRAGKHPLVPNGVNGATTNPEVIGAWFSEHSNANVGIATGHGLPGGGFFVVLDVDPGRGGAESLARLEESNGPLPRDAVVETGGHGLHVYMRCAVPLPQSRDKLGPGLEVKSLGGYVVAPPSRHVSGRSYEFVQPVTLFAFGVPAAPQWFVASAREVHPATPRLVAVAGVESLRDQIIRRSHRALAETPSRHGAALAVGQQSVGNPVDEVAAIAAEVFPLLANALSVNGDRTLTAEEVERTVRDGHAWALEHGLRGDTTRSFEITKPSLDRVTPIKWAWRDRLMLGGFNLLVGDEGAGKGTLMSYLAARLTHGELEGDLEGSPNVVVFVGDEDSVDRVWTPRLDAAQADLDYVRVLRSLDDSEALSFPRDAPRLREVIVETGARAVFLDQLLDNLEGGLDDWRSKDVRQALAPVRRLADELETCIVGTLHTNKQKGGTFRQAVSGSHGFNALSRSSLLVAMHPEGPESRRVISRGKGNYARRPESLEFTIKESQRRINGQMIRTSVAVDFRPCALQADDLLAALGPANTSKAATARDLIRGELDDFEWHDAKPIIAMLAERGIDDRAVRRARESLGVEVERKSEYQGGVRWRLTGASRGGDLITRFTRNSRNGEVPPTRIPGIPASPGNRQGRDHTAGLGES